MLTLLIFSSLFLHKPLVKDSTFKTQVEIRGSFAASGNIPLWQRSLQYGQMPLQANTAVGIIKHEKTDNIKNILGCKYVI